jgi:hypothetical protein
MAQKLIHVCGTYRYGKREIKRLKDRLPRWNLMLTIGMNHKSCVFMDGALVSVGSHILPSEQQPPTYHVRWTIYGLETLFHLTPIP